MLTVRANKAALGTGDIVAGSAARRSVGARAGLAGATEPENEACTLDCDGSLSGSFITPLIFPECRAGQAYYPDPRPDIACFSNLSSSRLTNSNLEFDADFHYLRARNLEIRAGPLGVVVHECEQPFSPAGQARPAPRPKCDLSRVIYYTGHETIKARSYRTRTDVARDGTLCRVPHRLSQFWVCKRYAKMPVHQLFGIRDLDGLAANCALVKFSKRVMKRLHGPDADHALPRCRRNASVNQASMKRFISAFLLLLILLVGYWVWRRCTNR